MIVLTRTARIKIKGKTKAPWEKLRSFWLPFLCDKLSLLMTKWIYSHTYQANGNNNKTIIVVITMYVFLHLKGWVMIKQGG